MTSQCNAEKYVCLDCGAIVYKKDMITFPAALACLKYHDGNYLISHVRVCKDCACYLLKHISYKINANSVTDYESYIHETDNDDFKQFITEYFNEIKK